MLVTYMSLSAFSSRYLLLSHRLSDSFYFLLVSCPVPLRSFLSLLQRLLQCFHPLLRCSQALL